jgi:hypothetical protein
MRSNVVLVDWESVQPESFDLLTPDFFKVIVFVGSTQRKLPFDVANRIHKLGERAEFVKISGAGRNALDFHIAYYVGRLAAADPAAFFHIISEDGGFGPLIEHLREQKIFSARWPDLLESIPVVRAARARSPRERAALMLARLSELKAPPPRSEKTLRSSISGLFNKQLSDNEIAAVVDALRAAGDVVFDDGRLSFPALDSTAQV